MTFNPVANRDKVQRTIYPCVHSHLPKCVVCLADTRIDRNSLSHYRCLPVSANSTDLKWAAFEGDLDKVRSLIESGFDPNSAGECGSGTLLNFHPSVTDFLLANGAIPDSQANENGASVLAGLCYVDQIECVKLILEHGANPNLGRVDTLETPQAT